MTEIKSDRKRTSDGPVGPKVSASSPKIESAPTGDNDQTKKKNPKTLKHASTSSDVLVTEPCEAKSGGNFEELVERRLIRRQNSFTEGKSKP